MKRLAFLLLLLTAMPALAAEQWWEAYNRGVKAINSRDHKTGAAAIEKAIASMPNETTNVRQGSTNVYMQIYVPHFYLGIAKFNLGDTDGALREWAISEEHGVVQKSQYYSSLKDWVARAQTEKQRIAESAASEPKRTADAALSRALMSQSDALAAGGDRTEKYREASRKYQEATAQRKNAGTDVKAFQRVAETASQARELFAAAAEEGKRIRAARNVPPPVVQQPAPQPVQRPVEAAVTFEAEPKPVVGRPQPQPPATQPAVTPPAPQPAVESSALAMTRVALQNYRRELLSARGSQSQELREYVTRASREAEQLGKQLDRKPNDDTSRLIAQRIAIAASDLRTRIAHVAAATQPPQAQLASAAVAQLQSAYRKYASGDLQTAETMLTKLLERGQLGEAYLLRGCARFTAAMLSRQRGAALDSARADFRTALQLNSALTLDRKVFSPTLVQFFEQVKSGR
ncbi:MAG TPA: hypothetical protein VGF69_06385 [Thermoanaerobaculia bacterium]|jgi:hypothetical protein